MSHFGGEHAVCKTRDFVIEGAGRVDGSVCRIAILKIAQCKVQPLLIRYSGTICQTHRCGGSGQVDQTVRGIDGKGNRGYRGTGGCEGDFGIEIQVNNIQLNRVVGIGKALDLNGIITVAIVRCSGQQPFRARNR